MMFIGATTGITKTVPYFPNFMYMIGSLVYPIREIKSSHCFSCYIKFGLVFYIYGLKQEHSKSIMLYFIPSH